MRGRIAALAGLALLLLSGPAAGRAPEAQTAWFTLYGEDGAKVGRIIETTTAGPEGREVVDIHGRLLEGSRRNGDP